MTAVRRTAYGIGQLAVLAAAALALCAWLSRTSLGLAAQLGGAGTVADRLAGLGLDHAVELPLAALGALTAAWLAVHAVCGLVVVVAAATGRPSRRLARVVAGRSPALVRRITRRAVGAGVGLGIGASVVLAGAGGAFAAPHALTPDRYASVATQHGSVVDPGSGADVAAARAPLDLGWRPTSRPARTAAVASPPAAPPAAPTTRATARPTATPTPRTAEHRTETPKPMRSAAHVVVRRGDTLWSIAAAHLGPHATDARIARAWPTWYAANRATIGPDPGLLLPGAVLVVPADTAP